MTNPVPSSCRWHDGALPRTFSTLRLHGARRPGCSASAGSGGPVAVTGSAANGLSTSREAGVVEQFAQLGRELLGRRGHHLVDRARAPREPRTPDASPGKLAEASGSATSQATSTTAMRLQHRAERRVDASDALAGDPVADPAAEVHAGRLAQRDEQHHDGELTTIAGARVARCPRPAAARSARRGSRRRARRRTTAARRPCRGATRTPPASSASTITTRSTQLTRTPSTALPQSRPRRVGHALVQVADAVGVPRARPAAQSSIARQ